MIFVRRARGEDAESVAACLAAAFEPFRSQYPQNAFQDTVPGPEAVRGRMTHMVIYVATTSDEEIVGTVAVAIAAEEGHLRGMAVLPAWQGQNIAGPLLRMAENDLHASGCVRITLDTTAPLKRAIRFYERNGFVPSGKVTDYFGMPLYEYLKQLTPQSTDSETEDRP
jgi:ribosomal protein S18 acetylase RimI-like enzyme